MNRSINTGIILIVPIIKEYKNAFIGDSKFCLFQFSINITPYIHDT